MAVLPGDGQGNVYPEYAKYFKAIIPPQTCSMERDPVPIPVQAEGRRLSVGCARPWSNKVC